jgi:hypothetical protein
VKLSQDELDYLDEVSSLLKINRALSLNKSLIILIYISVELNWTV